MNSVRSVVTGRDREGGREKQLELGWNVPDSVRRLQERKEWEEEKKREVERERKAREEEEDWEREEREAEEAGW